MLTLTMKIFQWILKARFLCKINYNTCSPVVKYFKFYCLFHFSFESRESERERYSMLGLGDIVMPGLLLCFVLRYDNYKKRKLEGESCQPTSGPTTLIYKVRYFHCTLIGYFIGKMTEHLLYYKFLM